MTAEEKGISSRKVNVVVNKVRKKIEKKIERSIDRITL